MRQEYEDKRIKSRILGQEDKVEKIKTIGLKQKDKDKE